jgi:hypothetical protein
VLDAASNRPLPCAFCEGTGLWPDPDIDPQAADPCPLCCGVGTIAAMRADEPGTPEPEALTLERILAALGDLTAEERQRLYEVLHTQYDCRIYR